MGAEHETIDFVVAVAAVVTISIVMDFTGCHIDTCVCAGCSHACTAVSIAHFLFTRLTNVGVFVELVASATDTTLGGCGDADDDRIYNKTKKEQQKL